MEAKIIIKDGKYNVTVYTDNDEIFVCNGSHPNYNDICDAIEANDPDANWKELFSVKAAIEARFDKLSERVAVGDGTLYFDGDPVDDSLAQHTLRVHREGGDFKGLVAFMENIAANPNEHSRTQLYDWLRNHDFTITTEGLIVAYKGVETDGDNGYQSGFGGVAYVNGERHEGKIPYAVGDEVEMPRSEVAHNPGASCSTGLHVGTFGYAQSYADAATLEVHVNPRDVVSVPTDAAGAKIRVCRFWIVGLSECERQEAIIDAVPVNVDDLVTPGKPRFEELAGTARKQKKSIKALAEKKGWVLVGDDPKNRKSWKAPRAPKRKGK